MQPRPIFPLLVVLLALLLSSGCQNNDRQQAKQLKAEVMAIHDEAMAKTGYMHELSLKLEQLAEKKGLQAKQQQQAREASQQLEQAQAAMMRWMHQYAPAEERTYSKQLHYFQEQKKLILQVQQHTDQAIARGEALIQGP
ncbi:hypothetical protein [Desulfogranum mediterraneum]|uniref:hypothetical protein n=1 Tax=Desulfogranum mediterraneum TaxID=160661 RepID=UPI000423F118|nr:hypothetical protein [Desulfogranum mediterraneum]